VSERILKTRVTRVKRLGRALLRHLRTHGGDERALKLRLQLSEAVTRLDELTRRFVYDIKVVDAVLNVRLGLIGLNDQIVATLLSDGQPPFIEEPQTGEVEL
jgi:hypothetical protein